MAFDPTDPFFETTVARLVDDRISNSETAGQVRRLQNLVRPPTYTAATKPASPVAGQIIFVSDGGAGSVFLGWDGSSWVALG